jgi:hypothetical protein
VKLALQTLEVSCVVRLEFSSNVTPHPGRFLVSWQSFVGKPRQPLASIQFLKQLAAIGLFLGACSNLIFHNSGRWQLASAFIPAVPLMFLVLVCSE